MEYRNIKQVPRFKITMYNKQYYHRYNNSLFHKLFIQYAHRREPILRFLKKRKQQNSALLDVGCGSGTFLQYAQDYFQCTGIDISKAGLKEASYRSPKSCFEHKSVYELNTFKKESFDIVTCFDVLEHVLEVESVVKEVYRILKNDGIFVMSSHNTDCFSRELKWLDWFGYKDKTHIWFYSPSEWELILKQAGFIPMRHFYNGLIDPPYLPFIPQIVQELTIKYPTQALSILGFPIPKFMGELFFLVAIKNPGWESKNFKVQQRLISKKSELRKI